MRIRLKTILLAAGAAAYTPAFAAVEEDAASDGDERDEIFVTAGWRHLAIDDAPVFAVAIDRQTLLDRRAFDADSLFRLLPGVEMVSDFTPRASGLVCRNAGQAANAPLGCGVVIDGVPMVESRALWAQYFGIESVVFTTGAQSVNAPSAIGGHISINTIKPGDVFDGSAFLSVGENGHIRGQGGFGGPVADGLFGGDLGLRLDGFYERSDGRNRHAFLDAPADFIDGRWGMRARAVYAPRDWLELDVKSRYSRYNQGAAFFAANFDNDPNVFIDSRANRVGRVRGQDWGVTARASVDLSAMLDGVEFSVVGDVSRGDETGFQDLDFSNIVDLPGGAFGPGGPDAGTGSAGVLGFDIRSNVIDARLARLNDATRRIGWEAGFTYARTRIMFPAQLFRDDPARTTDDIRVNVDPSAVFFAQDFLDTREIAAGWARADVDVTDRLNLAGAIRYEETAIASVDRVSGINASETFEAFSWNAVASYRIADALVFASYRKANRAGGFNPAGLGAFDMETRREAEAGFRAPLFDGRARISAAGFCGWTDDVQIFSVVGAAQRVDNLATARNCGAEGAVDIAVSDVVNLYATYSITDAKITRAPDRPDLIGNATPNSFDTVNFGADLRQPLGRRITLIGGVDARFIGGRIWDVANAYREDGTLVADLRLGLERDRVSVSVFAENVTDARRNEVFVGPPESGRAYSASNPNQRRLIGAVIEARF